MKQNDVNYVETVGRVKSVFFPKEKRCLIRLQVGYNMPEFFCEGIKGIHAHRG